MNRKPILREVHPHEILISTLIFGVVLASLFAAGYLVGHRGMDDIKAENTALNDAYRGALSLGEDEGWFSLDEPLRINAECHGNASDWATIEMANEVGFNYDLPVFVHGNCLTHQVTTIKSSGIPKCVYTITPEPTCGDKPCSNMPDDTAAIHAIINVPADEGQ